MTIERAGSWPNGDMTPTRRTWRPMRHASTGVRSGRSARRCETSWGEWFRPASPRRWMTIGRARRKRWRPHVWTPMRAVACSLRSCIYRPSGSSEPIAPARYAGTPSGRGRSTAWRATRHDPPVGGGWHDGNRRSQPQTNGDLVGEQQASGSGTDGQGIHLQPPQIHAASHVRLSR